MRCIFNAYIHLFQGSTAEGLCIFKILERNPENNYDGISWNCGFDIDIMHIDNNINIIDYHEFDIKYRFFLESRSPEEWASPDFCEHEKEPLVRYNITNTKTQTSLFQFVGLLRPACDECLDINIFSPNSPLRVGLFTFENLNSRSNLAIQICI